MADTLRVLSLFSGALAGLDRGFERGLRSVGVETRTVCYVEIEAFAACALVAAMERGALAPAPVYVGDVGLFRASAWRGLVDVVIGGFPCPPVSSAGKRLGVEDERWLWPEVVRCLRETGARYLFVENVRGLLSANRGRAFGDVLGDLADLGFDAEWVLRSAADVGAPHRRERVFLLAHSHGPIGRGRDPAPRHRAPTTCPALLGGDGAAGALSAPGDLTDGRSEPLDDAEDAEWRSGEPGEPERGRGGHRGAGAARNVGVGVGPQGLDAPGAAARAIVGADGGELGDSVECDERGLHARSGEARRAILGRPHEGAPRERDRAAGGDGWPRPWPPGPGDRAGWAAVLAGDPDLAPATQPDVRGMDDGRAPRFHKPGGVDHAEQVGSAEASAATDPNSERRGLPGLWGDWLPPGAAPQGLLDAARREDPVPTVPPEVGQDRRDATEPQGEAVPVVRIGFRDEALHERIVQPGVLDRAVSSGGNPEMGVAADDEAVRRVRRDVRVHEAAGDNVRTDVRKQVRMADTSARVDRLRALGNGVVERQARSAAAELWERLT